MPGTVAERATEQVTALRTARLERGWSLKQLVELLRLEADRQEVRIGTHPASVKSLLIAWEKGRRTPRAIYVRLLTALYDTTAEALGLPEPKTFSMDNPQLADLFANYHGFVRGWIFRRLNLNDWHLADDLASETFIKTGEALAKEPEGFTPDNPYRFLAVQARWVVAEYWQYRRPKKEQFFDVDDQGRTRDWAATDALSRPEETVTGRLSVLDLLNGLTERERELLVLRYFDGLTPAEIEERTGLNPRIVRRTLNKTLATMRSNAVVTWLVPGAVREMETAA